MIRDLACVWRHGLALQWRSRFLLDDPASIHAELLSGTVGHGSRIMGTLQEWFLAVMCGKQAKAKAKKGG